MTAPIWYRSPAVRYAEAGIFALAALCAWWLSSPLHSSPFILFLAAVIVSARFCGFGPGLFATGISLIAIDYIVYRPQFAFSWGKDQLAQLAVFVTIAILAASIARQKSRADLRTERIQRQMADIVENSEEAILSKDINGIITSWNAGAERLYGYRADEVIGKHVSLLAPPEEPNEIDRIMATLLRGERVQRYLTQRMRKDGRRLTIFISISPIRDEHGRIVGASTIAQDVTAQMRAEEALRKNEKLATAGRLVAAIAHEINNPLEAIANLLYLTRRNPGKVDEYLAMAENEVHRIAGIAQQTLGLVRDPASSINFEVAGVLDEVLRLHQSKLVSRHIRVQEEYEPGSIIRGFPGELRQVFSNLISNAVEAMPHGGHLRVRVEHGREWSNAHRTGVRVSIADTGSGIAPDAREHLFEPLFTTKKDSGTGLGLWLSYNIVQKHGGSIRVRSRTGPTARGTVFSIFLPEKVDASQAA